MCKYIYGNTLGGLYFMCIEEHERMCFYENSVNVRVVKVHEYTCI